MKGGIRSRDRHGRGLSTSVGRLRLTTAGRRRGARRRNGTQNETQKTATAEARAVAVSASFCAVLHLRAVLLRPAVVAHAFPRRGWHSSATRSRGRRRLGTPLGNPTSPDGKPHIPQPRGVAPPLTCGSVQSASPRVSEAKRGVCAIRVGPLSPVACRMPRKPGHCWKNLNADGADRALRARTRTEPSRGRAPSRPTRLVLSRVAVADRHLVDGPRNP